MSRINFDDDMKEGNKPDDDMKEKGKKPDYKGEKLKKREYNIQPSDDDNELQNENEEEEKGNAEEEKGNEKNEKKNYSLKAVTCYYSYNISGICRFIEDSSEEREDEKGSKGKEKGKEDNVPKADEADVNKSRDKDNKLKRFIVLNTHGIYNFKFSDNYDSFKMDEKFEYPESLKCRLNYWYTDRDEDIESFEVYNLEKMELVTTAKRIRKEDELYNFVKKHDYNIFNRFTIGKLHFCFTQGNNTIKLYCMENGLQVVSKKFDEIEKIHLLEFFGCDKKLLIIGEGESSEKNEKHKFKFIVWDLYDTGRYKLIEDNLPITTNADIADIVKHLTSTSGNVLQIDNDGKVLSVIKKVKEMLKQKKKKNKKKKVEIYSVKPIVNIKEKEPWVLDENDESSNKCYNLYQNEKEAEILQLIVGRSTVQIWHQIKNKNNFNKEEPFLEFIWTNHIPVYQEREATKLQIEEFEIECESNDKSNIKIKDFYLKIYWYERNKKYFDTIKTEQDINHIIKEEDNEIDKIENKKINDTEKVKKHEKVIQRKDIIEKFYIVRHACKALEHFNKRYINKDFVDNYVRVRNYEEMVTYIKHIVWKFVKYEPQNFKLLDVRYNIMKNLILGDCDNLIKFILFGDDETYKNKNKEIGHIPSNKLWPGKKFLRDDDLDFDKRKNVSKINELQNNMELAIYHCKGKDTTIVACLLEYYSNHAIDDAGWMCTVSKAIPLLFKYNYDDYIEKLFLKECFAGHTHNSVEISINFLTFVKSQISNFLTSHNNEFRSFEVDKLKTISISARIKIFEFFKNEKPKLIESPLLRIVPLPNFIVNNIKEKKEMTFFKKVIFAVIIISIIVVKNFQFSDGFESTENNIGLTIGISFSIFLIWIEFIIYLLLLPYIGVFIYHFAIIFKSLIPFFLLTFIVILAFAHTMFVLLRNPVDIKTNNSTYSGSATNSLTNETLFNIELKQDFDSNSSDNPFTTFSKSILAAYFWINGNWIQRDEFDFWVVDLYTFIASIFLVIVLQNMLIAFMSDEYEAVKEKSRQILLKYKANRIADYEALNHVHLFSNPESQPKYIFYHGLPESYEKWYNIRKDDSKSVIYDNTKEFNFEKFKISDYDQYSIWKYNNYSNIIRMSTENFKNNFSNKIETLIEKFKDEKQIVEIEKFREMLKDEFYKISTNGIEKVEKILEDKFEKTKKVVENEKSIGQVEKILDEFEKFQLKLKELKKNQFET
ncbi:unnamed protein product [Rhizophagus irregularis]|nr:unnamed protein product [Rhizophagus irregularis]